MKGSTFQWVTARFPENRVERVTGYAAAMRRVDDFVRPRDRLRLKVAGRPFGRWLREEEGDARFRARATTMPVGEKLIVQRESDGEALSIRKVQRVPTVPDLHASPKLELLIAETYAEFGDPLLRDGGLWYCLAGETPVLTPDGWLPIAELAGTTATVLTAYPTGSRGWIDAPVRAFGRQQLYAVTIRRGRREQVVYATAEHRWMLRTTGRERRTAEATTTDLIPGEVLQTARPQPVGPHVRPSAIGVAHGVVWGDGTLHDVSGREPAEVVLYGAKDLPLLAYFPEPHVTMHHGGVRVTDLPRAFKRLPSFEEASSYLYGFLAGWFAADGDVTRQGQVRLSSADREAVEFARVLGIRLGISSTPVAQVKRLGYGPEPSLLYSVAFHRDCLTSEFFVLPKHRKRFSAAAGSAKGGRPPDWSVVSVEPTDRVEEVYCAVVPGTECFVIGEWLLTGNCRYVAGTRTVSKHGFRAADGSWLGAADDTFVTSGGMPKLEEVADFQAERVAAHGFVGAHVIVNRRIYTHRAGKRYVADWWDPYGGVQHFHTHEDVPEGVPCSP